MRKLLKEVPERDVFAAVCLYLMKLGSSQLVTSGGVCYWSMWSVNKLVNWLGMLALVAKIMLLLGVEYRLVSLVIFVLGVLF